jgi:hypothetical protein
MCRKRTARGTMGRGQLTVVPVGAWNLDLRHDRPRDAVDRFQNPMASRSSSTVPRPGSGSALRMRTRLRALGLP